MNPGVSIDYSLKNLVPQYLMHDRTGYALVKAMEAGLSIAAKACEDGLAIIQDPDKMPAWRLDEMAGELGCLYDYSADIENKRYWIKNAIYLYTAYGTPQAILNFLQGYYLTVKVEEFWQYGGEPFHFRVIAEDYSHHGDSAVWAEKAIARVKNTRSVLDGIYISIVDNIVRLYTGGYVTIRKHLSLTEHT